MRWFVGKFYPHVEARQAFESFIEAAHKATAQAEGTANALQSSASAKALNFTEANLKAAFDHAQKLIQTDFLLTSYGMPSGSTSGSR